MIVVGVHELQQNITVVYVHFLASVETKSCISIIQILRSHSILQPNLRLIDMLLHLGGLTDRTHLSERLSIQFKRQLTDIVESIAPVRFILRSCFVAHFTDD